MNCLPRAGNTKRLLRADDAYIHSKAKVRQWVQCRGHARHVQIVVSRTSRANALSTMTHVSRAGRKAIGLSFAARLSANSSVANRLGGGAASPAVEHTREARVLDRRAVMTPGPLTSCVIARTNSNTQQVERTTTKPRWICSTPSMSLISL